MGKINSRFQKLRGYTTIQEEDGSKYVGKVVNGLKHGKGTLIFQDGATYTGDFNKGLFHGKGYFQRGQFYYDGEFQNGAPHGKGKYLSEQYKDQVCYYEAEFDQGHVNGKGEETCINQSLFKNKRQLLKAHKTKINPEMTFYYGMFKESQYNGLGTYISKNQMVYEGLFLKGKQNGNGILKDVNGDKFVGRFKDNVKDGLGMFYGHDGIKWELNYNMGKKNGPGVIYFDDKSQIELEWIDDQLKGDIIYKNKSLQIIDDNQEDKEDNQCQALQRKQDMRNQGKTVEQQFKL